MIYPKKISARTSDKIIKYLMIASIIVMLLLILINKLTTPNIPWAAYANAGIIYTWITVVYSIKKNINIAGHVLLQTIAISALNIYLDYAMGFSKWSLEIAVPSIIIIANITMFVLTIVSRKRFIRYAIYQLIIIILSMLPLGYLTNNIVEFKVLGIVAVSISIINFLTTLILTARAMKETVIRKFHI